jgi:hypothetical protein
MSPILEKLIDSVAAMNTKLIDSLAQIIAALSDDERQLLQRKIDSLETSPLTPYGSLREEPFIGMWQDREDLADSSAWVRTVRQQHWTGRHATDAS